MSADLTWSHVRTGIREWFRWYKTPDDKPINSFGFDEAWLDAKTAVETIEETNHQWKALIAGDPSSPPPPGLVKVLLLVACQVVSHKGGRQARRSKARCGSSKNQLGEIRPPTARPVLCPTLYIHVDHPALHFVVAEPRMVLLQVMELWATLAAYHSSYSCRGSIANVETGWYNEAWERA